MSSVTITEVLEANEEALNGLNRLLPQLSTSASSLEMSSLQVGNAGVKNQLNKEI